MAFVDARQEDEHEELVWKRRISTENMMGKEGLYRSHKITQRCKKRGKSELEMKILRNGTLVKNIGAFTGQYCKDIIKK